MRSLSRRSLAKLLGAAAGASFLRAELPGSAAFAAPSTSPAGGPIRLNANENPDGPCASSLAALAGSAGVAARYPFAKQEETQAVIARHHGVKPEQIVLGCGSSDVLRMADSAFLGPGKKVVAAEPTFEAVLLYARVTKADPVKVAQTADFRHDLPAMAAACDANTGLVYVCNPNNPTGTIVGATSSKRSSRRSPHRRSCSWTRRITTSSTARPTGARSTSPGSRDNVVVARTFSKIYGMAGMRLGYAVGSAANIAAMERCASWDNTSQAALAMGLAALADAEVVPTEKKRLNDTRRWLCAELAKDGRRYIPSEANFVMIDVGGDVVPIGEAFRARGILVGRKFPSMPNWLRVSIGTPAQTEAFVVALRAIVPARAAA